MQQFFFIRSNGKYIKISFQDIVYVEGCRNYIRIVTDSKAHLVLFSMKGMEQSLPSSLFKRIHKSYIVSLNMITGFDSERVYLANKELPIGQQYKNELERAVVILNDTASETVRVNSFYSVPMVVSRNQKSKVFEA